MKFYKRENYKTDLIQKTAWRLVRSAFDRMGEEKGTAKLLWCIKSLKKYHSEILGDPEDYIRAAYINFKIEKGNL